MTDRGVGRLLDTVDGLAAAVGRDDLRRSLATARDRTARGDCHVLVVGEFSQGKSALVNALVGAQVCGVSATAATAVTTVVRHAERPGAHLLVAPEVVDGVPQGDPRRVPVPLEAAPAAALRGTGEDGRPLLAVEVGLPRGLLAEGLVVVDTPGVGGGFAAARAAVTMRALSMADALVLVTDAAHELTAPEVEFLGHALELCPVAVCALTKTDLYPEWERIAELDRGHLRAAGLAVDLVPLATPLRELALDTGDPALWAESGYAVLSRLLSTSVLERRREAGGRSAVTAARNALGQLDRQLETERATIADPAGRPERMTELQEAKQHAERMQSASARWQHVLADEVRLSGRELVEDLDARMARLRKAAQERLDAEDPARSWGDFEPWLTARTNAELTAHHRTLLRRSAEMTAAVAAEFDLDVADLPARSWLPDGGSGRQHARAVEHLTAKRVSNLDLGMNAARGFSLSSSVAGTVLYIVAPLASVGLAVTLPILAGLGAVFAVRSARSSRDAQLRQARAEATRLVAGYLDQTRVSTWRADEDTIDGLRRALRDHFAARAAELVGGARANVAAALEAAQVDASSAQQRLRRAEQRSAAVRRVAHAVDGVLAATAAQRPAAGVSR